MYRVAPQLQEPKGTEAGIDSDPPIQGTATLGDFRIVREVGRGGMGVVYEAEQLSLGRKVALKVLPFAAMLDERQLARFKTEAQAAALLHHQNVVPIFGIGTDRGVHYYAMQYIEGQTLAQVLRDIRRQPGLGADLQQRTTATDSGETSGHLRALFRDPSTAVELATKATELAPKDGNMWNTLGVANYRAEDYTRAIKTLEKSVQLGGGSAYDFFFLAMAHWKLSKAHEAQDWYSKAIALMTSNDQEQVKLRDEAAELLRVSEDDK